MASIDLDSTIKSALKHLHSSAPDSAEQLRLILDEHIRHIHGSSKTLGNVLQKKYLNEESSEFKHKRDKNNSKPVTIQAQSPQRLQIPDDDGSSVMDGDLAFDLLEEDLTCAVCRQIAVQAGNRLVECDACHALYHQDCHKPVISDEDMSSDWQCSGCLATQGFSISAYTATSKTTHTATTPVKTSPSRHSSSSSTPIKISPSSIISSSSKNLTPNINIISADKRLQIMKKKAAKQQEKRKHK